MHIIRQPRINLIARQEFLHPEHIRWTSDSEVPAQALTVTAHKFSRSARQKIEAAGGRCQEQTA